MNDDCLELLKIAESAGARGDRLGVFHALASLADLPKINLPEDKLVTAIVLASEIGDDDLSLDFARTLTENFAGEARAWHLRGQADLRVLNGNEALAAFQNASQLDPALAGLDRETGHAHSLLGSWASAILHLRAAVKRNPDDTTAFEHLAGVLQGQELQALMPQIAAMQTRMFLAPPEVRISLHHARAKGLHGFGEYSQAFEQIQLMNKAKRDSMPAHHKQDYATYVDQLIQQAVPDIEDVSCGKDDAKNLVFLLGIPRSGTTLLEQLLLAHKKIDSIGENQIFWLANRLFGTNGKVDATLDARQTRTMASFFWQRVHGRRKAESLVLDKSLRNETRLGLIRQVFPKAKVIWIKRDALDTAWSCYRTHFSKGNTWSLRADDIAAFMHDYQKMMQHWQRVFGDNFLQVDYESLIDNPDQELKRVQGFLGVKCVDLSSFHTQQTTVATASFAQVREPINKKGLQTWKPYADHLGELRNALAGKGLQWKQ